MNLLHRVFQYELPTEIVFGMNAMAELPGRLKKMQCSRVLVISDPGVAQAGILQKVTGLLEEAGIAFAVFTEVEPEPDVKTIGKATEKAKEFKADVTVGVGGGSAQDAAKAVAVMVNNEGKITQYAGLNKVPNPGVPIVCIPTTSGTGSEVTIWSVISEKENHMKFGIGGKFLTPTLALCDPSLTLSLPPHITAATGMDALAHALESFVNKATQPISRALSRESMRLVAKSLRKAVAQGENLEARYDMMLASTIAAMAFNPTRLGLAHSLAMPLGGQFKIAHGLVNAILLPQVMAFNLPGNLEGYKEISEIFGENTRGLTLREAAERSVKAIGQLNQDIGIPANMREYGIAEKDLDSIAVEAMASGNTAVNPRKTTLEDFKEIVRKLM
jgi:alcohol dehydrogenase